MLTRKAKEGGLKFKAISAAIIINPLLSQLVKDDVVPPNPTNIARVVNRAREKVRLPQPQTTLFEINPDDFLSKFYRGFVEVGKGESKRRHLIFARGQQLRLLRDTKRWYMDGTFQLVKKPFLQLDTIHGFLRVYNTLKQKYELKQIPLLCIIMSKRPLADYNSVFRFIKEKINFLLPQFPASEDLAIFSISRKICHIITFNSCISDALSSTFPSFPFYFMSRFGFRTIFLSYPSLPVREIFM